MNSQCINPPDAALLPPRGGFAPPLPTLCIIGGGQLARMMAQAAAQFGCAVVILERQPEFPATGLATRTVLGDWNDPDSLLELASLVDVVTLENEFVDADALAVLEQQGHNLWPSSATMRLVQDKLIQKQTLAATGLPVPRMRPVERIADVAAAADERGFRSCSKRDATPTMAKATPPFAPSQTSKRRGTNSADTPATRCLPNSFVRSPTNWPSSSRAASPEKP